MEIAKNSLTRIVLSLLGGALLAIPFLVSAYPLLVIIALVIGVFVFTNVNSIKHAAIQGAIFGLAFFALQSSWLAYLNPYAGNWAYVGWLALVVLEMNSFILFAMGSNVIHRKIDSWLFASVLISLLFVLIEIVRSIGPIGYPLGLAGIPFVDILPIAKIAAFTGWPGLTFLAILLSSLFALAVKKRPKGKEIALTFLVIVVVLLMVNMPNSAGQKNYKKITILQPNIAMNPTMNVAMGEKKNSSKASDRLRILRNLINKSTDDTDMVIAPETSLSGSYPGNRTHLDQLNKLTGADLIIGSLKRKGGKTYNSALSKSSSYDKNNLVLFGENVPFDFLNKYIKPLRQSLTPGKETRALGKTAVLICSESFDWLYARNVITKNTDLIAVISNDAWFGKSSFSAQHLNATRLRAIENGRYLAMASNSGYSALISSEGRVIEKANIGKRVILTGSIVGEDSETFFNKYGYWVNIFLMISGLIACLIIVKKS